jgi:hypothetical protein
MEVAASGEVATGTWYLWQPNTAKGPQGDEAIIIAGMYKDEFRRVNGEWRIARLQVEFSFISPYDKGWVQQRFIR